MTDIATIMSDGNDTNSYHTRDEDNHMSNGKDNVSDHENNNDKYTNSGYHLPLESIID